MKILIMRHGEAERLTTFGGSDRARNLTDIGQSQAQYAGQCLLEAGEVPDKVWVSPYQRAQQTAAAVLASFPRQAYCTSELIVPEGHSTSVIESIGESTSDFLMLISHQPFVSHLVSALAGLDLFSVPMMAPASMVLLEAEEVLPGCCELRWHRHSPEFTPCY